MHSGQNIEAGGSLHQREPEHCKVSIWLVKEDGHWSALASEFNVVGMGASEKAALENLRENLNAYLASFRAEGATLREAQRRIPYKESLRLWFYALLTRFARMVTSRKRRQSLGYSGPRTVQHSHEDLGPIAMHC